MKSSILASIIALTFCVQSCELLFRLFLEILLIWINYQGLGRAAESHPNSIDDVKARRSPQYYSNPYAFAPSPFAFPDYSRFPFYSPVGSRFQNPYYPVAPGFQYPSYPKIQYPALRQPALPQPATNSRSAFASSSAQSPSANVQSRGGFDSQATSCSNGHCAKQTCNGNKCTSHTYSQ